MKRRKQGKRRRGGSPAVRLAAMAVFAAAALAPAWPAAAAGFSDVPDTAWYAVSLERIQREAPGVISGMGDGTFRPDGAATRAQFAKMLCAFSGTADAPDFAENYSEPPFEDVSGWAVPYVAWAVEQELVQGTGSGRFTPEASITREQLAALLYRYARNWDKMEARYEDTALTAFSDGEKTTSWGKEAVKWEVSNGILNGYGAGILGPRETATRAQVAAMLCNYMDYRAGGEAALPNPPEPPDPPEPAFQPRFTQAHGTQVIDAPYLDQRLKYPTGCESVSAVMALQYFGVNVTPEVFIDGYLPKGNAPHYDWLGRYVGCDPRQAFPGNPYTQDGWGCYSPVIQDSLEHLLQDRSGSIPLTVRRLDGSSLNALYESCIRQGIPVILWATIGMEAPQRSTVFTIEGTNQQFQWIYPMHCLLWIGRDSGYYYFNDPLSGKAVRYSRSSVERAYTGLGQQAVAVLPE